MRRFAVLLPLLALVFAPTAFAQATATPGSAPAPSPTPAPVSAPAPTAPAPAGSTGSADPGDDLGATPESFSTFFGAPDQGSSSTSINLEPCQGGGPDQIQLTAVNDHVNSITRVTCTGQPEDDTTVQMEASGFYPVDAPNVTPVPGQQKKWSGMSPLLATELTPDQFKDCSGNPVAPGTFYLDETGSGWRLGTTC